MNYRGSKGALRERPLNLGKRKMRVRIPSVTKGPLILERLEIDSFLVQKLVVDPVDGRNIQKKQYNIQIQGPEHVPYKLNCSLL